MISERIIASVSSSYKGAGGVSRSSASVAVMVRQMGREYFLAARLLAPARHKILVLGAVVHGG
jgi:hypothetical protein